MRYPPNNVTLRVIAPPLLPALALTRPRRLHSASQQQPCCPPETLKHAGATLTTTAMINAFLVFNGQGQPRLTKFYTQLVRLLLLLSPHSTTIHPLLFLPPS